MRLLFKSETVEKAMNDWPLGFYGSSISDNNDYAICTHYLKADEVPEILQDSKTTSQFIAGLLNAYFKNINVTEMEEADVCRMGIYVPDEDVAAPNPNQSELPF